MKPISLQPTGAYTQLDELLKARFAGRELNIFARRLAKSSQGGRFKTAFRGRGMEFSEVRQYQPGDDVRSIDWRVTARAQQPYTKLYSEERERPVFFLVDQRASMFFGSQQCFKSVYAAQLVSLLGWGSLHSGDRIGGMIGHSQGVTDIRPKGSQHVLLSLLRQLHQHNNELSSPVSKADEPPLHQLMHDCLRSLRPGSALVIASDFHDWDSECSKWINRLARHNDIILFHVHDPIEANLPTAHQLAIGDGTNQVTIDRQRARKVRQAFDLRSQSLQDDANRLGLSYHRVNCQLPLIAYLQQHFAKKTNR